MVEFRAFPLESSVELSWTTASEYNNDFFTIEKSNDGQIFTPLINIKGNGNSTNLSYYSEIDDRPYLGTSYYRLKQTDFDGATTTSDIVAVNFSEVNSFNVSPNPAVNHFYIQGQGMEEATVLILNSIGQEIKLIPQTDKSYFRYDTSNLEKGNYLVRIIYQNTTHFKKLIVQ